MFADAVSGPTGIQQFVAPRKKLNLPPCAIAGARTGATDRPH
jgi:hypothetical protein